MMRKFWVFLSSVNLSLWLLAAIIAASFAGALLPAQKQPLVYASWWFLGLLALFSLNLLACILGRMASGRLLTGSVIVHTAVLVIMVGALVSFFRTERGTIELSEGRQADSFLAAGRHKPLGFAVRLDDFSIKWYGNGPLEYDIRVILREPAYRQKYLVRELQEEMVGGSGLSFSVQEYMPDFALDENNLPFNRSSDPRNPAVRLRLRTPSGEQDLWVFANHPEFSGGPERDIRLFFVWEPMIREFSSTVSFLGQGSSRSSVLKVNHPASFGGYTFYQAGYDLDNPGWTSLEVARDPGAPVVFTGFFLLNAGLVILFLPKIKTALSSGGR